MVIFMIYFSDRKWRLHFSKDIECVMGKQGFQSIRYISFSLKTNSVYLAGYFL